jgi:hypothetical protein
MIGIVSTSYILHSQLPDDFQAVNRLYGKIQAISNWTEKNNVKFQVKRLLQFAEELWYITVRADILYS